jgi:hypothetical protein
MVTKLLDNKIIEQSSFLPKSYELGTHNYGDNANDIHDARSFERINLGDGKFGSIPRPSSSDLEEPIHVARTGTPKKTPGWYQLILGGAMARHSCTSLADIVTNYDGPQSGNLLLGKLSPLTMLNEHFKQKRDNKIDLLDGFFQQASEAAENNYGNVNLTEIQNYKKVKGVFESIGRVSDTDKTITDAYSGYNSGNQSYKELIDDVKSELKKNDQGLIFDSGLGIITGALTLKYGVDVYKDIHRCFAEVVAYEKYDERKKASDVNAIDIFTCENKIVKEACQSFVEKNLLRGGVCLSFFARAIGRYSGDEQHQWLNNLAAGNMMLGVLGVLLVSEVTRPDSTLFDDITELRDHKLNPQRGMGAQINASDLFDLYQKYCLTHSEDNMFKDATRNDNADAGKWETARAIFERMAEMMNHTYKYKNPNYNNDNPVEQIEQDILSKLEYFTLPKFIYSLSHDMIDFNNPELTLACAEISNTYSVQAAKQFWETVKDKGVPIEVALKDYVVDLNKTLGSISPELDAISAQAPLYRKAMVDNFLSKNPELDAVYNEIKQVAETIKQEGRTTALARASDNLIKEARDLLNHYDGSYGNQNMFERFSSVKRHNHSNDIERFQEKPKNAVNQVVPFNRLQNGQSQTANHASVFNL